MKFQITPYALKRALDFFDPRKTPIITLSVHEKDVLSLTAEYDYVIKSIRVGAKVDYINGRVAVLHHDLADQLLATNKNYIEIEVEDTKLVSDEVSLPKLDSLPLIIPAKMLFRLIDSTLFAVKNFTLRVPVGVEFSYESGKARMVGTNGFVLAHAECRVDLLHEAKFSIPRDAWKQLRKFFDSKSHVIIAAGSKYAHFEAGDISFAVKKCPVETKGGWVHQIPNYKLILPSKKGKGFQIEVTKKLLDFFKKRKKVPMTLRLVDNLISIFSEGKYDCGHCDIPVKYKGEEIRFRFNPIPLYDFFSLAYKQKVGWVSFEFWATDEAVKMSFPDYTYLVMPMREKKW